MVYGRIVSAGLRSSRFVLVPKETITEYERENGMTGRASIGGDRVRDTFIGSTIHSSGIAFSLSLSY